MMFLQMLFVFCLMVSVAAQIPCDDVYGASCPEHTGWAVGDCVRAAGGYSEECGKFMEMSDICKANIEEHCKDKAYTGDLVSCLTEWTKPEQLTEECLAALPKKETKKDRGQTKEQRAKANKRRRTRMAAARQARDMGL